MPLNIKINDNLSINLHKNPHLLIYGLGHCRSKNSDELKDNLYYTEQDKRYSPEVLKEVMAVNTYWYKWANVNNEIEERLNERYELFNATNVNDIEEFNMQYKQERMKYVVVFVTLPTSLKNVDSLQQILMKGRAAGIHIIMLVDDLWRIQKDETLLDMFTTKIVYRTKNADESVLLTGESGAELLNNSAVMLSELGKKPVVYYNNIWLNSLN